MMEIIAQGKKISINPYKKINNYIMYMPEIGYGTLSKVYPIKLQNDQQNFLAVKLIPSDKVNKFRVYIERMLKIEEMLKKEDFSLKLIRTDLSPNYMYMFYPLINQGSLQAYLSIKKVLPESEVKYLSYHLIKIVMRLHKMGIIHRDINPQHLYLNPKKDEDLPLLIGGFLLSVVIAPQETLQDYVGTEGFIAPEVFMCQFKPEKYSQSVDTWSIGAVNYTMLFGTPPSIESFEEIVTKSSVSQNCKDFLMSLLERDATKRGHLEQILNTHPFFHQNVTPKDTLQEIKHEIEQEILNIPTWKNTDPYVINYEKKLGEGSFSTVFECSKMVNGVKQGLFAMKRTNLSTIAHKVIKDQLKEEIKFMLLLKNQPCTLHLFDYFLFENDLYMVIEFCNGGSLTHYVQKMKEKKKCLDYEEINLIAWDVALALQKTHERNIIHRDIKSDNILLVKNSYGVITDAKVCDYGLSKNAKIGKTILGTPLYWPPELFVISKGQKGTYSNKIDVWSYGILIYFIAYGVELLEYSENSQQKLYKGEFSFPNTNSKISPEFQNLLRSCLQLDPEKRPSFDSILAHPYFQKIKCFKKDTLPMKLDPTPIVDEQNFILYNEVDRKFVVKRYKSTYSNTEEGMRHIKNELEILSKIKGCPNIVHLNQFFLYNNEFYLEMESCNCGNVRNFMSKLNIQNFPQPLIKNIAFCLVEALIYIHERDIFHRDIRPEHILLNIDANNNITNVMLAGFGNSRFLNKKGEQVSYYAGDFCSPEMITGDVYREETDIYSFGALLYFLAYNKTPKEYIYAKENLQYTIQAGNKINYPQSFPQYPQMSKEFYDLVVQCMGDQYKRIKAIQMRNHPFFK